MTSLRRDLLLDTRKDVKDESKNISIVQNTAISAFTDNPINLAVVSPSSEGKTYLVVQTLSRFPQKYIWMYRKISPKTFTRERGQLALRVVEGNKEIYTTKVENEFTGKQTSVGSYLSFLKEAVSEKKKEDNGKPFIDKDEAQEALSELEQSLYTLIDFRDRVLVFLDRPDDALWNEILSILSHDKEFIVTSFVEGEGKKYNKKVVFQGWPAVIFCTSKDEDFNWPDLETRFQIIEPVMSQKKYRDAVEYDFKKEYSIKSTNDKDEELEKRLGQLILWIIQNRPRVIFPFPPERIPQAITLGEIPSGGLMRKLPRIGRHVAMNALFNKENRVILYNGKEHAIVVAYEDVASLAYLFDDLDLGASLAGIGSANFELLTKVIAPMFQEKRETLDSSEFPNYVKQSEIRESYAEYVRGNKRTHLGLSAATFTRRMKELEKRGFIKRVEDEENKRGLKVIPTWSELPETFSLVRRLKWLGIPRPDEIPYKLTEAEKKLVSPWRIQDFSAIDYLKNLNYTAYLKDRKLISQEPKIIESKKGLVLEMPNFTRFLMEASGYGHILQAFCEVSSAKNGVNGQNKETPNSPSTEKNDEMEKPRILYGETIHVPLWDNITYFYYTAEKKIFHIEQGGEEEGITGSHELELSPEDILTVPGSIAKSLEEEGLGKILKEAIGNEHSR